MKTGSVLYLARVRQPAGTSGTVRPLAVAEYVVPLLVHPRHVGFIVPVAVLEGGVPVLGQLPPFCILEGGDRAQLVEDLVLLLESEGGEKVFEVVEVELPFPALVDHPQQAANFFSG
jgi:hypothetical protein